MTLLFGLLEILLGLFCARSCVRHFRRMAVLFQRSLPLPKPGGHWWEADALGPEHNNDSEKVEFFKENLIQGLWALFAIGLLSSGTWAVIQWLST